MPGDATSPDLNETVLAAMKLWFEVHWGPLRPPLTLDTPIEDAYGISGDDIWEMLEWVQDRLQLDLADEFFGPLYFHQEGRRFWKRRVEPLTPRIVARSLLPIPDLTLRVMLAISRWCIGEGVGHHRPVLASLWVEDVLSIRGERTQQMIASVCEQLKMILSDDFEPRRHLRHRNLLWSLIAGPPVPLTPQLLADHLRPRS